MKVQEGDFRKYIASCKENPWRMRDCPTQALPWKELFMSSLWIPSGEAYPSPPPVCQRNRRSLQPPPPTQNEPNQRSNPKLCKITASSNRRHATINATLSVKKETTATQCLTVEPYSNSWAQSRVAQSFDLTLGVNQFNN